MSNETEHTPGPWRFVADGEMNDDCDIPRIEVSPDYCGPGYYNNPSVESARGVMIAGCDEYLAFGPRNNPEERAANVRLICAAPELLDLLRRVMPYVEMGWEADDCDVYGVHGNDVGDWQAEAEAVIAKATA